MNFKVLSSTDWPISISIIATLAIGLLMLWSIAPFVFPQYLLYVAVAVSIHLFFTKLDFNFLTSISGFLYIGSILFLVLPIFLGVASRGAVRWIFFGTSSIQPAEIVRPFLILFFAHYFTQSAITLKRLAKGLLLMALPLILIFLQPSLGVTIMTSAGFLGVLFCVHIPRRYVISAVAAFMILLPPSWLIMAPYQKTRVLAILNPTHDPTGASYNSIQSMIAVGAGSLTGRGLGRGTQTQLSFLPEKHNDFMFASISEELGFVGAALLLGITFFLLFRLIKISEITKSKTAKAFSIGVFMSLFLQIMVHVGMNMGMFPITGLPFPLVSYGGSSLVGTLVMYGIVLQGKAASDTIQQYEIRSLERPWKPI